MRREVGSLMGGLGSSGRRALINPKLLGLTIVAMVAVGLRFHALGISELKLDEVDTLRRGAAIARGEELPLAVFTTSVGLPDTPLTSYLMAIPARLSHDPLLAVGLVAVLHTGAVILTYVLGARLFTPGIGFIAGLLYAVNPWAVYFSRKIWSNHQPVITVLILIVLAKALFDRRPWLFVVAMGLLAIHTMVHLLAALLVPAAVLTWLAFRDRLPTWSVLASLAIFGVLVVPYAGYVAVHWTEMQPVLQEAGTGQWQLDPDALLLSLDLTGGNRIWEILGDAAPRFEPYATLLSGSLIAAFVLYAMGVGLVLRRGLGSHAGADRSRLMIAWYVGPLVPLLIHFREVRLHWLNVLQPLPFLMMGVGAGWLLERKGLLSRATMVLIGALLTVQAVSSWALFDFAEAYGASGGVGVPIKYWRQISHRVHAAAEALGVEEVQVLTRGLDPRVEDAPAAIAYLLEPELDVRFLWREGQPYLLLPGHSPALYLATETQPEVAEMLLALGEEVDRIPIPSVPPTVLYGVPAIDLEQLRPRISVPLDASFSNGVRFLGYDLPARVESGEDLRLLTFWAFGEVSQEERDRYYSVFNHLVDRGGRRWAQADGIGPASFDWRNGEALVQWYTIAVPPDAPSGSYEVLTGMYSLYDGARPAVLGGDGTPMGDSIRLGPVQVIGQ